ncbi:MAG: transposase [Candidatus Omnitrophica bacterium]|nr:transposase [Candidatus Omnitrophota bacterium]
MPYPRRLHHPGLIYHVINRGNNQQPIFHDKEDYRRYLGVIYRYKRKFGFRLFAYCLMTNHVHLLVQVGDKASISQIMQSVTICHTRHHHTKYKQSGHLWQGRFRSPIVSDDEYLKNAMIYIEQNPVRAGMANRPEDYPWSSYLLNVRHEDSKLIDRSQNPLNTKNKSAVKEWIKEYKSAMRKSLNVQDIVRIRKTSRGTDNYMSKKFTEQMTNLLPKKRRRGRPRKNYDLNDCNI